MTTKVQVDAVAHDGKSTINSELEELRKLHLAQNLRRKASVYMKEKRDKNHTKIKPPGSENKFSPTRKKGTKAYVGDSWAMQQRARAEEEKRKRQEAESFLRGYRSNVPNPTSPNRRERKKVDEELNYHSKGAEKMDDFAMKQSPPLSPSPSWNNDKVQSNDDSLSRKKVGGIIKFFSKRKLKESSEAKQIKNTIQFRKEKFDPESNKNVKVEDSQSPISVVQSNTKLHNIPTGQESDANFDMDKITANVQQLRDQFDKHEENDLVLRKTVQKEFRKESLSNMDSEPRRPPSIVRKKVMVPNFNLEIYVEFNAKPQSEKDMKLGLISETWEIHFIFVIYFSSKRMNEVSLRSRNIRDVFEQKFGEIGISLIGNAVERFNDDKLTFKISALSSRATNTSVIESFNKKEPIKVLVQASLDIKRSDDYDNIAFRKSVSKAFRKASAYGSAQILDDIH